MVSVLDSILRSRFKTWLESLGWALGQDTFSLSAPLNPGVSMVILRSTLSKGQLKYSWSLNAVKTMMSH